MKKGSSSQASLQSAHDDFERKRFYNELVDKYYTELEQTLLRHFGHSHDFVEVLMQEVFKKALENYDKLKNHENPGGWLYNTAKRTVYEIYRETPQYADLEMIANSEAALSYEDEYHLDESVTERCLNALKGKEENKQIFIDFFLYGFSLDEVAAKHKMHKTVVKSRIARIKFKLKKLISQTPFLLVLFFHI